MNKVIGLAISSVMIIIFLVFIPSKDTPTITYFPPQKGSIVEFINKDTKLAVEDGNLLWESSSKINKNTYLRQDLSLLLHNDKMIGVLNKWKKNHSKISLNKSVPILDSGKYEAISLHFGEIHDQDSIYSIQNISQDSIYLKETKADFKSFSNPKNKEEHNFKNESDKESEQAISMLTKELTTYFKMDMDQYNTYSIMDLNKDKTNILSTFPKDKRDKIIGRLWEGIYKNYAITLLQKNSMNQRNSVPIILIDKKNTHLIVLYELNGVKEKLIQRF